MRDFGLQFPGTSGAKGIPSLICSDAGTLAGSVVFNRSRWLRLLTESDKEASMSRHSRACEGTAGFSLPELQNRSPGRLQAEKAKFEGDKAAWLKIAGNWQRLAEEADPMGQQAQQPQRNPREAT
jgi:hypothetical protein